MLSVRDALLPTLTSLAQGALPANMAVMQLCIAAYDPDEVKTALLCAVDRISKDREQRTRLRAALALMDSDPWAFDLVKQIVTGIDHRDDTTSGDEAIERVARSYDGLVRICPEASVALYTLGDPQLLRSITDEIVQTLGAWGLLGPERRVLDIGTGIGRFLTSLAPSVGLVLGVDVSEGMVAEATSRTRETPNALAIRTSGRDLSIFAKQAFDLVLAVDSFPYLVQSGLAEQHIREAARLLSPDGDLVIMNYSYRAQAEQDVADLLASAQEAGLQPVRMGDRPFTAWDGAVFHLRRGVAEPTQSVC